MQTKLKCSLMVILLGATATSFAAFGVNAGVSTDSATKTISSTTSSSNANTTKEISEIVDLGIKNQNDQAMWSNFVKNCMLPNLSHDQIASLATGGVDSINKFLTSFTPSQSAMTMAYNKLVSCPDAKPAAQKLIEKLTSAQATKTGTKLW
ncbi:hypothetical protein L3V82_02105 [Thiotrichales bacterium 19S3-7]|nr:hypothetical protein [Thiotrichales bacterium 19S3-7]MCF6800959.1 hypothetical protein [Thiotrichales bacterium 19S3-11]